MLCSERRVLGEEIDGIGGDIQESWKCFRFMVKVGILDIYAILRELTHHCS